MQFGGPGERQQICRIRSQNVVAVGGQANDSGVDGIGGSATSQQHARPLAKPFIESDHFNALQQNCQRRLPPSATTPDLADHAAMSHRFAASKALALDECYDVAVAVLNRQERPGVADQHLGMPLSGRPCG
jgi:hypothetical protein